MPLAIYLFNLRIAHFGVSIEYDHHDLALRHKFLLYDLRRCITLFFAVANLYPLRLVHLYAIGFGTLGHGFVKRLGGFVAFLVGPVDHHPVLEVCRILDGLPHLLHEVAVLDARVLLAKLDLFVPDLIPGHCQRRLQLNVELGLVRLLLHFLGVLIRSLHPLLGLQFGENREVLHEVSIALHVFRDATYFAQLRHQIYDQRLLSALLFVSDDLLVNEQRLVGLKYLYFVTLFEVLDECNLLAVFHKGRGRFFFEVYIVYLVKAVIAVIGDDRTGCN